MPRPLVDEEQKVIDDLGALKALSDPQRLTMLLAMTDRPRTVKDVAASMGVPPTRLYYHVGKLVEHGLLHVVSTRMVSGIEERSYQATAQSWTLAAPLLSSALARTGVIKALFDVAAAELALSMGSSPAPLGEAGSSVPVLVLTRLVLDADQVAEVKDRMDQLMLEFGATAANEDEVEYHALLTVYRRP